MPESLTDDSLPPYSYVPRGPWPHPFSSPQGHSHGQRVAVVPPFVDDAWEESPMFLRAVRLFNAGYYWEAHEAWESLWHAHGRHGAEADLLKALIKLAAAGVKVREGQPHGIGTHAYRARTLFQKIREGSRERIFGLDLKRLEDFAETIAANTAIEHGPPDAPAHRVFAFQIEPTKD